MNLRGLLDADWRQLQIIGRTPVHPRGALSVFSPRFAPIVLLRMAQRLHARGHSGLAKLFSMLNVVIFGLEVPSRLNIGPGLVLPHVQGTVLGAGHIGANVTIFHQVTLGAAEADFAYDPALRPHIDDGVTITAGAKVLGPVRIGTDAIVGANAVVLKDVPPGALAIGVPARNLDRQEPAAPKRGGEGSES